MEIEERVRELEVQVEALKMLVDKALDMAMDAKLKTPSSYMPPPMTTDELKELIEQDVVVDEKVSPFSLKTKLVTQKMKVEEEDLFLGEGEG